MESTIGRGKFAVVKKCVEKSTGRPFAAKCIRKRRANRDCTPDIFHEIAVLEMSANEPYLIDLYRVYETASEVVLILEYAAGGEIFDHCVGVKDTFSEAMSRRLLLQILEGVHFLHDNNIVHLDLKPQNILLTKEGTDPDANIKLVDFGLSKYITNGLEVREILGTPDYVAPEVLNYEPISTATDIWSLGVVSYVMLTGVSPFLGDSKQETLMNVTTATIEFPADLFGNLSPSCQDLIHKMLQKDPSERMTAKDSLTHPWVSGITNPAAPLSITNGEHSASSDEEVFAGDVVKSTDDSELESASEDNNNTINRKGAESPHKHAPEILVSEAKDSIDHNGNYGGPGVDSASTVSVMDKVSASAASNHGASEMDLNGNIIEDLGGLKDCTNEKAATEAKNGSDSEGLLFLGETKLHLDNAGEFVPACSISVECTGSDCTLNRVSTVFTNCEPAAVAASTSNPDAETPVGCFKSTCCVPICANSVAHCLPSPAVRPRRESNKENLVAEESVSVNIAATVKTLLESESKDQLSSPRITRLTLSPCTNSPNTAPGPLNALLPQSTDDLQPVGERSTEGPSGQIPAFKPFSLTVHVPPGFTLVNGQSSAFKPQPHKELTPGASELDPSLKRRKFDYCKSTDQGATEIPVVD